jgi:hypothetical protein
VAAKSVEFAEVHGAATVILAKDSGKNAEPESWKFDAALVAQVKDT